MEINWKASRKTKSDDALDRLDSGEMRMRQSALRVSTRDARFGLSDGNTGNWSLLEAFVRESANSADMDLINCRALRALLSMKMGDYFVPLMYLSLSSHCAASEFWVKVRSHVGPVYCSLIDTDSTHLKHCSDS